MTAPGPLTGAERLALLDGVVYADGFDCALTEEEVRRCARVAVSAEALTGLLDDDPDLGALVARRGGLVCLAGREELLDERPERLRRARRLQRRTLRVAGLVRRAPFVRGLALTGSLAADDARPGADADLLVIVAPGRLASAFLLLAPLARLTGRRLFCPNFYLAEDRLAVAPDGPYVEHEALRARPLWGAAAGMRAANPWIEEAFPNAGPAAPAPLAGARRSWLQRALEALLAGRLEARAAAVAERRLTAHHALHGESVPDAVLADLRTGRALRFHGGGMSARARERYEEARARLAERLDRAASVEDAAALNR